MKRFILILLTIVIATAIPTTAQFDHWGSKIGLRANLLFPENEYPNLGMLGNDDFSFDWFKLSYLGEVFYAIELSRAFELQLNAGYGSYAGAAYSKDPFNDRGEYKTTIIPIHLRIKLSPFNTTTWNPFLYAGGGVINYSVKTKPIISGGKLTELDGWAAFVPGGIGAEFTLSDNVFLELTAGGAVASTYGLDAFKTSNDAQWDAYLNFGAGISAAGESCSSDDDGDGLGKCDEEKYGTDADDPDTDNDGLSDGEEILNSKSNPLELDSDMDGLSDYDEVIKIKSNPLNADTDADGLTDSKEVFEHKTNPCEPDSDFDGLNDNEEISKYGTNPSKDDTDGEGLKDGDEVLKYKTDPFNNDTDSDGLFDGEEVMKYKIDPNKKDTDGGTVNDLTELERGTNPLDADDDVVKIGVPIILDGVTFESGKTDITPESAKILRDALQTLNTHPDIQIEISGHTDNVGSQSSNTKLSQRRADAVREWLIERGIDAGRIIAIGYGPSKPIVPNDTDENKRKNRRIEFKRIK